MLPDGESNEILTFLNFDEFGSKFIKFHLSEIPPASNYETCERLLIAYF